MTEPYELALGQRTGLPDALRVLLDVHPRATWETHEGFSGLVAFWMQRHMMFRHLTSVLQKDALAVSAGEVAFEAYAPSLSQYAGTLVQELHAHHHIEDHHYFPKLIGLDARIARGFDLLDADHAAMDGLLNDVVEGANRVLQGGPAGPFAERMARFADLLERHLTDEEEIVVPVILKTGFQG